MYKFIDLFCGIGGFRKALEEKGLECVFSSDIDQNIQKAYKRNFGDTPRGDITKIPADQIPPHDVLCAGFPCQSFSISGSSRGMQDKNGRLFYEIIRIAKYHQPPVLLLENVKNILSIDNGNIIRLIDQELTNIGYTVHKDVLNASWFGIPQARRRVYFVCLRKDFNLDYSRPQESYKQIFLEDILEQDVPESLYLDRDDIVVNPSSVDRQLKPIRIGHINKCCQGERIYSPRGHSVTLLALSNTLSAKTGLYYINNRVRRLSITECKTLMGFPRDHYVASGYEGYKQLGNSVIPQMISRVYESIKSTKGKK